MNNSAFSIDDFFKDNRIYVLIIYDIIDDARRRKLVKYLQGYGYRVQKSAFESKLKKKLYRKLLAELPKYVGVGDNIRVYQLSNDNKVMNYGTHNNIALEQIIIA